MLRTGLMRSFIIGLMVWLPCVSFGGVVSGGGGSTLPPQPVADSALLTAISQSRMTIDVFLKGIERFRVLASNPNQRFPEFDKMFQPGTDVFQVLENVKIVVQRKAPCFDYDGKPVDASVNAGFPNGICVSLSNLSAKLGWSNYENEIAALLLHEVSHLMGTDETEARDIQKIAIPFMAGLSPLMVSDWMLKVKLLVDSLGNTTAITDEALKGGAKISCDQLGKLSYSYLNDLEMFQGGTASSLTREKDSEYYMQLGLRMGAATAYLCSLPGWGDPAEQKYYSQQYASAFPNGATAVSGYQYEQNTLNDGITFDRYPLVTVSIDKYGSVNDVTSMLDRLSADMTKLSQLLGKQMTEQFSVQ